MMRLDILEGEFAIAKLGAAEALPEWAGGEFFSITRTREELSIVCESARVPAEIFANRGWRCIKVRGPLDFSLVGILASLAEPLARASISIFAISTFDTDHILVKADRLPDAIAALESAGHVTE